MKRAILLLLALSACTSEPVKMVNPGTGQTATCGPYLSTGMAGISNAQREAKCIDDFRSQGYQRAP